MEGEFPIFGIVVGIFDVFVRADSTAVVTDPYIVAMLSKIRPYRFGIGIEKPCATDIEKTLLEKNWVAVALHSAEIFVGLKYVPKIENVAVCSDNVELLKF